MPQKRCVVPSSDAHADQVLLGPAICNNAAVCPSAAEPEAAVTKLSLRDLFVVVTLAAVFVAWWLDHRRLQESAVMSEARYRALQENTERVKADALRWIRRTQAAELKVTELQDDGTLPGGRADCCLPRPTPE